MTFAKAIGPVIVLPENASEALKAHELHHVKQYYAFVAMTMPGLVLAGEAAGAVGMLVAGIVGVIVWHLSELQREIAAYAAALSVRVSEAKPGMRSNATLEWSRHYAETLRDHYGAKQEIEHMQGLLIQKSHEGGLF
ncbi:MAG: hypothetical protein KI788_06350 [Mameliella sp.]|nr:hypothetical protein [Mameliella sp.]